MRLEYYSDIEKKDNIKEKKITTIMEFYSAVINPDDVVYGTIMEEKDVVLYIKKDDNLKKTREKMIEIC